MSACATQQNLMTRENIPCTACYQSATDFCTRSDVLHAIFQLAKHCVLLQRNKNLIIETVYFFCWGFHFCLCVRLKVHHHLQWEICLKICFRVSFLILFSVSSDTGYCSNTIFVQELNRARHPREWDWWPWGQLAKLLSWELYIPGNIEFCESEFRS